MARPVGATDRALAELTIGTEIDKRRRTAFGEHVRAGEREQQIKVPIGGTAANGWGFVDDSVGFDTPFAGLPVQRDVPFEKPHFTYGVENIVGDDLVLVHAGVLHWKIDNSNRVTGAKMRYAVCAPMLTEGRTIEFSAMIHLRFQGWAGDIQEGLA